MSTKKQVLHINKEIFQELRKTITDRNMVNYTSHIKTFLKENRKNGITYTYGKN